ncbi:NAD(P)-binding domain-containing protein [Nitrogeniibacter mangrovi]|uniref:NAD(P)-binding domain-containing protein n=1 Tax=Nitrogeniibacter mangrovi TaxID=2016596 RepID=A0A6C1B1D1_9RHOO|nr:FAD-dependent oxidoreductase [Nitrogeniibacter mangrovi]QID17412.1 NAD(P)-binding domain-containing protein [Nitrogeniibacter mangrovi]
MAPHQLVIALLYVLPLAALLILYVCRRRQREARGRAALAEATEAGLNEPASLHPEVDPVRCIGSGSCARVCPEQALALVDGKARLVNASACIGHGACQAACPFDAITLVFGTARRGMDIPKVNPDFQTNVPGIFIAGELGGMGLVRKAVEQGSQAMASIVARARRQSPPAGGHDVLIVGAGPAGLSAALAAKAAGLDYALIEQETSLGGTIYHYPRNKIVMTAPMKLPIVGMVRLSEISKEALLALWQRVIDEAGIDIQFGQRMERLASMDGGGFSVTTSKGEVKAGSVLLAVGRRGTPRKLEVPGEEQSKVVYRLVDAEQYRGARVLVVGGGDSALEAALALGEQPGTTVTLSYRGDAFGRVKGKNRSAIEEAAALGRVQVLLRSRVERIEADSVALGTDTGTVVMPNDHVIVCAGGILPISTLKDAGIVVETKYGTA